GGGLSGGGRPGGGGAGAARAGAAAGGAGRARSPCPAGHFGRARAARAPRGTVGGPSRPGAVGRRVGRGGGGGHGRRLARCAGRSGHGRGRGPGPAPLGAGGESPAAARRGGGAPAGGSQQQGHERAPRVSRGGVLISQPRDNTGNSHGKSLTSWMLKAASTGHPVGDFRRLNDIETNSRAWRSVIFGTT